MLAFKVREYMCRSRDILLQWYTLLPRPYLNWYSFYAIIWRRMFLVWRECSWEFSSLIDGISRWSYDERLGWWGFYFLEFRRMREDLTKTYNGLMRVGKPDAGMIYADTGVRPELGGHTGKRRPLLLSMDAAPPAEFVQHSCLPLRCSKIEDTEFGWSAMTVNWLSRLAWLNDLFLLLFSLFL